MTRKPFYRAARAFAFLAASLAMTASSWAGMTDYCQVPSYVIQNVPPTIMILEDNSGSMFNLAYRDGFSTGSPSACTDASNKCVGFTALGSYPTYKFYGYFDPDYWYVYGTNSFSKVAPKVGSGIAGAQDKGTTHPTWWDGSFLNWMTMRRIDVVRWALTGGKPNGSTVEGEIGDCNGRGKYFHVDNAALYTSYPSGPKTFDVNPSNRTTCDGGGSGSGSFCDNSNCNNANTFNVRVEQTSPTGVLQNLVGARARVGIAFFNVSDGGYIQTVPTGTSLSAVINQLNLTRPNANTPVGEALWSVAGYFSQTTSIPGFTDVSPRYTNGSYNTNTNNDPLNYGSGGSPRYPACAKSFVLLLTDGEPCADGNLPANMSNYAQGRSDFNCNGGACSGTSGTGWSFPNYNIPTCSAGGAVAGVEDVALWMHTTDLRNSPTVGTDNIAGMQNLTLYVVNAFNPGSTLLQYAAINGGFEFTDSNLVPDSRTKWDTNADGIPDTYFEASDGQTLVRDLEAAFSGMLKRASSGTAASVLASGEGSGANLLQAIFYPQRRFGNDVVPWTGSLQNLWYFVDPFFTNANIREETTHDNKLNLANDDIAQFFFDTASQTTMVHRYKDTNGDGVADAVDNTIDFESLGNLWEAGKVLFDRDLSLSDRTIYTQIDGQNLHSFTTSSADQTALSPYLLPAAWDNAYNIIRYVRGYDDNVLNRQRTVTLNSTTNTWKLGDIVNSTPRIAAGIPLNKYDSVYNDITYKTFINDNAYRNRGMVYLGGNDGMMHAFKLGKLTLNWTGKTATEKAWLENIEGSPALGTEMWGFIPKNALPYLKYLQDPDYCHLYYTDLAPYVFDASIGSTALTDQSQTTRTGDTDSWRTVVIGGMRTGGACTNSCASGGDCVQTPASGKGFSSYFALDVTDQNSPRLLWEFTDPSLGFATTGPAVIRINAVNPGSGNRDQTLNGEWYVVFGSGPTGPIDTANMQFLGRSNQNLKFFVLKLKTGELMQTIDTTITNAFAGSMINTVADVDLDYQDDAIYVGYTKRAGSSPNYTWTDGGIGRIMTKNTTPAATGGWVWSPIIDGVGPVTSAVARLQSDTNNANWLYFGTGRYYFAQPPSGSSATLTVDDAAGQRRIVAVKDPCFNSLNKLTWTCTTQVTFPTTTDANFPNVGLLSNVPAVATANLPAFKGWYINLDPADTTSAITFGSERIITDPLASTSGLVFFTSFKPYTQECGLGGKSFIWALQYNTGGAPPASLLKGKALVQVSTASVEQLNMSDAFTPTAGDTGTGTHRGGRRSFSIEGVPPTSQGLSLLLPPPPVSKVLHMRER